MTMKLLSIRLLILFWVIPFLSHAQPGTEDVGVYNANIIVSPAIYPGGIGEGSFRFEALGGVTLLPGEDIGITICMSKLAFNFVDSLNPINEIYGSGAQLWDGWVYDTFSSCLIGTINQDLPVLSEGTIYFPLRVTGPSSENAAMWSQNNININLQPHSNDAFDDTNDHVFGYTHTVEPSITSSQLDTNVMINESILLCLDDTELPGNIASISVCSPPTYGSISSLDSTSGCAIYTAGLDYGVIDNFSLKLCDGFGNCDTTFILVSILVPPCADDFLNVTGTMANGMYRAGIGITSDGIVENNKEVVFLAGEEILLDSNFEVKLGAEFLADIEPCD